MRDCDVVVACSAMRKEAVQRLISMSYLTSSISHFLSDILKLSSFDTVFSLILGFLNSFTVSQALTDCTWQRRQHCPIRGRSFALQPRGVQHPAARDAPKEIRQ